MAPDDRRIQPLDPADGLRQLTFDNPNPIHSLGWDALGLGLFSGALIVICIVASRGLLSNK